MVIRIVDDDEELLTSFRFLLEDAPVFWHGTSAWLFTYNKLWTKTYLNAGRTHQKLSNEPRYRSPFIGDLTRGTF